MQQIFTTQFIKDNCGCYNNKGDLSKLQIAYKENNKNCFEEPVCEVLLSEILDSNISLKDKFWFVCKVANIEENQKIAIGVAEIVLEIYEKEYPNNKYPREAIQAVKDYLAGTIDINTLKNKKFIVSTSATVFATSYHAINAVRAAVATADRFFITALAYTAAAGLAYTAADAAITAADFDVVTVTAAEKDYKDYKDSLRIFIKEFCNLQK